MKVTVGVALALQIVCASSASRLSAGEDRAQRFRLLPKDEATSEPALSTVRAAMVESLNRHDIETLAQNVDPGQWGFYGGFENFLAALRGPSQLRMLSRMF